MTTVFEIIATLLLIAVAAAGAVMFSLMIQAILEKNRKWACFLLTVLGMALAEAAVYSWLPGRLGYTVSLFEDAIALEDGAALSNLGGIFAAQAAAIGFGLAAYAWSGIRKKAVFSWKAFLLELLFLVLFAAAGLALYQNDRVIVLTKEASVRTPLLLSFAGGGAIMIAAGVRGLKK